jgi:hypothetical protein
MVAGFSRSKAGWFERKVPSKAAVWHRSRYSLLELTGRNGSD